MENKAIAHQERQSYLTTSFQAREAGGEKYIEGYFIVFNKYTKLWDGFNERISPDAIKDLADVRALYNHNHDLVLGTTKSGSLTLVKDSKGVRGRVVINQKDSDALNAYERIKRGDVKGCSFGFELLKEKVDIDDKGEYWSTITELKLFEVSPCVFPAYSQTTINARKQDMKKELREKAPTGPRERKLRQTELLRKFKSSVLLKQHREHR